MSKKFPKREKRITNYHYLNYVLDLLLMSDSPLSGLS